MIYEKLIHTQMSNLVKFNKDKKIGRVLFIVEGTDDEIYILNRITFNGIDLKLLEHNHVLLTVTIIKWIETGLLI